MFRAFLLGIILSALLYPPTRQGAPEERSYLWTLHFKRLVDTFSYPHRLTTDEDGNIYVSDLADHKIYMYDRKFAYVRAFGTGNSSDGVGDVAEPGGLAVSNGYLFVADTKNNRVSYFSIAGATIGYLLNTGMLNRPMGLATTRDGNLIVTSLNDNKVLKFSTTGNILFVIGGTGSLKGQFNLPVAVAVDAQNNLYVLDQQNHRVQKFDATGKFIREFGASVLRYPAGIAVDRAGSVLVGDGGQFYKFDWRGALIGAYDNTFATNPPSVAIIDIVIMNTKNMPPYVLMSDTRGGEVRIYENSTMPMQYNIQTRFIAGSDVKGMAFDWSGNLFVTESRRVLKFDRFGVLLQEWAYKFDAPTGIAADRVGNVYVLDANRVLVFDSNGVLLRGWDGKAVDGFGKITRLTVDRSLFVYIADTGRSRIYKYTTMGELVRVWDAERPTGIAVDSSSERVFVTENSSALASVFNLYGERSGRILNDAMPQEKQDIVTDGRGNIYIIGDTYLFGNYNVKGLPPERAVLPYRALAFDPDSGQLYTADAEGTIIRRGFPNKRTQTPGVWHPSTQTFILQSSDPDIPNLETTVIGANENDIPIAGDWDGDGIDTVGLYRPSTGFFYLWDSLINLDMSKPHTLTLLGNPNDQPLAGDWNADGIDGIGTYRPSNGLIYLQNVPGSHFPDFTMVFGNPNDIGLAGDWNGDGQDTTGTYRTSELRFYLTDRNTDGALSPDYTLDLGNPGDLPFVGNWSGNGISGVGVFRPSTGYFYLQEKLDGQQPYQAMAFGRAGDFPISGAWGALPILDTASPNQEQPTQPPLIIINTPTPVATINPR